MHIAVPTRKVRAAVALGLIAVAGGLGCAADDAPAARPRLTPVDGGPAYWGRFKDPLPSSPRFFPLSVWFESVLSRGDAERDKAAGINTYVQLTSNSDLSAVRAAGMHAIHDGGPSGESSETSGWLISDEADMWGGPGDAPWTGNWGGEGQVCVPASAQCGYTVMRTLDARAPHDGRMRHAHYGKGVAFWDTDAQAARFLNEFQDSVATDVYWFTDDDACASSQGGGAPGVNKADDCHVAANYGWLVRRERSLISPRGSKPVWGIVEVGHPFSEPDWPTIAPAQTRAAVWQSLIAGARGIIYFNHSFAGPCETQHALREPCYATMRATVAEVNRQVTELAPVLNAPFATTGWSQGRDTTAMVKWSGGHFYLFAGSAGSVAHGRFSIPCVGDAKATVLFENRSIPVHRGTFSDDFADGNAIHVYRIDGGSGCGLPGAGRPGSSSAPQASHVSPVASTVTPRSGGIGVRVACSAACTVRSRLTASGVLAATTRRLVRGRHTVVLRWTSAGRRRISAARRPFRSRLTTTIVARGRHASRTQLVTVRPLRSQRR